jgi:cell wall assembly regulator SMI1
MPPLIKTLLIITVLAGAALVTLLLAGPVLQAQFFYPKPGPLPAAVTEPTETLLNRLQKTLEKNAPEIAHQLQPGLSEAEINAQEMAGGFVLPAEIRALYRWHNGQAPASPDGLLPGLRFLPLETTVRERQLLSQQLRAEGFWSRLNFKIFAGHRRSWVPILDDGSGDGYYVDPDRSDAEGAFFYNFSEVRFYTWFPAFRNFLTGLIECYDTGAVRLSPDRKSLDENHPKTRVIWQRLSVSREG